MEYICSCKVEDNSLVNVVIAENKKAAISKFCSHIREKVGYVNHICVCCTKVDELKVI